MRALGVALLVLLEGCSGGYRMKYGGHDPTYRDLPTAQSRTALVGGATKETTSPETRPGGGYAVAYPLGYWERVFQLEPGHEVRIWVDGWTSRRFAYHHIGGAFRFVLPA